MVASYEESNEVEIRYVDYGGYKRVKVDALRQIRWVHTPPTSACHACWGCVISAELARFYQAWDVG